MPRPIWNGVLTFGLVNIPVALHSSVVDKDIHFHLVTPDGQCRLRQKLYCPDTGKEYDFSDTARGYEVAPDQYVIVDKEEIKALQPDSGDSIDIEKFVKAEEVDSIFIQRSYVLTPGKKGEKAYTLFREALRESGEVAIAHFVMRQHQYLALVRPKEDALLLETLSYHDEVRNLDEYELPSMKSKVPTKDLALAKQLIESLSGKFNPKDYRSEFREKAQKLLRSLAKGHKIQAPAERKRPEQTKVVDLTERLRRSLKQLSRETKSTSRPRATKKQARRA